MKKEKEIKAVEKKKEKVSNNKTKYVKNFDKEQQKIDKKLSDDLLIEQEVISAKNDKLLIAVANVFAAFKTAEKYAEAVAKNGVEED